MAACWRALHNSGEVEVFVVAFKALTETAFDDRLMQGIPCKLLNLQERQDAVAIEQLVVSQQPDVVYVGGWLHQPYSKLARAARLQHLPFLMGMDTPWQDNFRQRIGPLMLRSYFKRMARIVVTGERSWQCASRFGIEPERISRGLCGIDYHNFAPMLAKRLDREDMPGQWPRSFLFAGRYISIKGIDVLVRAYQDYRNLVDDPWELVCCGQGDLKPLLAGQPGIIDRGFMQPTDLETVWQAAGAFIMPSLFDPWPLAIVEAAAAGLPIICTDACGSAVEVVRSWYNGLVVPEGNSAMLTQALLTFHRQQAQLPLWGRRSQELAAPYGTDIWVDRWIDLLQDVTKSKSIAAEPDALPENSVAIETVGATKL